MSPQEAYNILFKNGYIGKVKSAKDIGDRYIFVFNSIMETNNRTPFTGPFRISVDKKNGNISMYNIFSNKIKNSIDVTADITSFYHKKIKLEVKRYGKTEKK